MKVKVIQGHPNIYICAGGKHLRRAGVDIKKKRKTTFEYAKHNKLLFAMFNFFVCYALQ
jgi:hypothetical protein